MELKKIQIRNFRSIKSEDIVFSHNCLILLGKNEAGKSNLLKAVASVFWKYEVSNKDRRKRVDNEKINADEYYVRAIFDLNQKDFDEIETNLKAKFSGIEKLAFKKNLTLNAFINRVFYQFLIQIDIVADSDPHFSYWSHEKEDFELEYPLFHSSVGLSTEGIKEFNLLSETFTVVKEYYSKRMVTCHYWQYSDDYLLPNSVNIEQFIENPSAFPALENIFTLCNRGNVEEEFTSSKSEDGDYANLLEQISTKVTSTFQKIWHDFKGTSIQIIPDGDQMLIKIVDKAKYNCEDRSDGFKKFLSILLMLSTKSRAKKISESDLILIDEPDQSLYPTSAAYLKQELLTISQKAKIIYSTHSQYMIDAECLDRHIVVKKNNDITTLQKESANAPFADDELLRRAIGTSIFECIKPVNIVFEGYLDKQLFNMYCSFESNNSFTDYGQIYLSGISAVEPVVSILISANKKFIVVSDSDQASLSRKREFANSFPEYKTNWLAYSEVVQQISTMEDFLSESVIISKLKEINPSFEYKANKSVIQNIEMAVANDKEQKQNIKNDLIGHLKKDHITNEYAVFIAKLKEKLDQLT